MKKIIVTCEKCGKNISLDKLNDTKTRIHCKKCGISFNVDNLMNDVFGNCPENVSREIWFYKYSNGNVRIGRSIRNKTNAIIFGFLCLFWTFLFLFSGIMAINDIIDTRFTVVFNLLLIMALLVPATSMLFLCIYWFLVSINGKEEFYIGKDSYFIRGINIFRKKRFNWSEIKEIELKEEVRGGDLLKKSYHGTIILQEVQEQYSLWKNSVETVAWASHYEAENEVYKKEAVLFVTALNYLHEKREQKSLTEGKDI